MYKYMYLFFCIKNLLILHYLFVKIVLRACIEQKYTEMTISYQWVYLER